MREGRRLEPRTCNSFIEVIELQRSGFVRAWSLHSPASFKEIRWRRSRTQGQAHGSRGRRRRTRPASRSGAPKNEFQDHRGARLLGDISKPGVTRRTPSQPTPHAGPHAAPAVFQARGFHSAHRERFVTDRATYTLVGPLNCGGGIIESRYKSLYERYMCTRTPSLDPQTRKPKPQPSILEPQPLYV